MRNNDQSNIEGQCVTYDILEAFFVTAARTPPPPLSFAVPFFLPFFCGICTPADAILELEVVLLCCEALLDVLDLSWSDDGGIQIAGRLHLKDDEGIP